MTATVVYPVRIKYLKLRKHSQTWLIIENYEKYSSLFKIQNVIGDDKSYILREAVKLRNVFDRPLLLKITTQNVLNILTKNQSS